MSGVGGTILVMGQASVRVRLDVTNVQVGVLLRAAGARRFAHNWAVAKIRANADQWAARGFLRDRKGGPGPPVDLLHLGEDVDGGEADCGAVVR